ncbi:MAG: MBL fold metallo-hydrolase [Chloroflexi bacterium]|nr:MBL fold metallo-hydrolase [Chloroflexota bacterium]
MRITFYGVRGSTPSPADCNRRYGGNTATVVLSGPAGDPILFDLGTGLREYGQAQPLDGSFRATALVTHIHWDHIQGLPFFPPILRAGSRLEVFAPEQAEGPLESVFNDFMRPPYFPVHYSDLKGEIRFHPVTDHDFEVGSAKVKARPVPHCGPTVGFRVDWDGTSVAYVSDHQAPLSLDGVCESVLELCDGVDLLIHDAQYTPEEFVQKADWGHCTMDYAVLVAREAGARRLCLFHHDPAHSDEQLDRLHAELRARAHGPAEVISAREGLELQL